MKKITMIFLSMLLVLSIGSAALADWNVGLNVGYNPMLNDGKELRNALDLGVSGGYTFDNQLSINADFSVLLELDGGVYPYFNAGLYAKYPVLSSGIFSLAVQGGVTFDNWWSENGLFVSLGLNCNVAATEKFNIYADVKIPVLDAYLNASSFGFFKGFYIDTKLGADYSITKFLTVGLELSASNMNGEQAWAYHNNRESESAWFFGIGAKVGYKF